MKRFLSYITVSIVAACALNSCQKYEYTPTVKAKVDGVEFLASGKANILAHVDNNTKDPQLLRLRAQSTRYEAGTSVQPVIEITVPHVIGTYTIDTNNKNQFGRVYNTRTGSGGMAVVSGEITILNIKDNRVQGNFHLVCVDGTTVTDGQYVAEQSWY